MNKQSVRLSLGALPKAELVKITISVSVELKAQLDAYAEVHGRLHQMSVDATVLIPHMLAAFIARDRGFKALQLKACTARAE
ncbi:DUF2274 domain-containing protein [Variovorax sp. E3]|uniref:DUF2274 domain-containing protein n=1 Tax=Variovorax sp. E3 TaxID=1914993 RepID=UPI0018DD1455|nr:DUF2274 domain-containing protein [Variovorax sp. E3]